jgi:hypothetical protein
MRIIGWATVFWWNSSQGSAVERFLAGPLITLPEPRRGPCWW